MNNNQFNATIEAARMFGFEADGEFLGDDVFVVRIEGLSLMTNAVEAALTMLIVRVLVENDLDNKDEMSYVTYFAGIVAQAIPFNGATVYRLIRDYVDQAKKHSKASLN